MTGLTRSLRVQNGELRDGNATLIPISETRFQLGAQERYYVFETTGATRPSFRIDSWEYSDQLYEPVDAWRLGLRMTVEAPDPIVLIIARNEQDVWFVGSEELGSP